jgi:hypothetical protein
LLADAPPPPTLSTASALAGALWLGPDLIDVDVAGRLIFPRPVRAPAVENRPPCVSRTFRHALRDSSSA